MSRPAPPVHYTAHVGDPTESPQPQEEPLNTDRDPSEYVPSVGLFVDVADYLIAAYAECGISEEFIPPDVKANIEIMRRGNPNFRHRDGIEWWQAPIPRRWHHCRPQSIGDFDGRLVDRCACGAIRIDCTDWRNRNERRKNR